MSISTPQHIPYSIPEALRPKGPLPLLKIGSLPDLAKGRLHEVTGPSAASLAYIAAAAVKGPIFWTGIGRDVGALRAKAIENFFASSRLIQCEAANRREILWCGEEALRCKGAGLVILQMETGPDLFESRRLQIAAQTGGALGIVLVGRRAQSSAAHTRWMCSPHPQNTQQWLWVLTKNKSGRLGQWSVCWIDQETGHYAAPRPYDLIDRDRSQSEFNARGFAKTIPCHLFPATAARPLETA